MKEIYVQNKKYHHLFMRHIFFRTALILFETRLNIKGFKMMQMIHKMLDWFKSLFWKEEMELTLVGLQHAGRLTLFVLLHNNRNDHNNHNNDHVSGKTTFVNVIASGQFNEDMIPTVGFNMRKITKGNVTIKLWDIGGQPRLVEHVKLVNTELMI